MKADSKVYQQRDKELDLPSVTRAWMRNWWVILLCGCILGMAVYMAASLWLKPIYISQATLVISNNGNDNSVYTDSAMDKVAGQYQKILSSTVLRSTVQEELGMDKLPGSITASTVPGSNLIILLGIAAKPGDAYLLAKSAVTNYAKVSDYAISSFVLEILKAPNIPVAASNAGQEFTWAFLHSCWGL